MPPVRIFPPLPGFEKPSPQFVKSCIFAGEPDILSRKAGLAAVSRK